MQRLAGEMNGFSFKNQGFGYQLSTVMLFHINDVPREKYVPTHFVKQSTIEEDQALSVGLELINKNSN